MMKNLEGHAVLYGSVAFNVPQRHIVGDFTGHTTHQQCHGIEGQQPTNQVDGQLLIW